MPDATLQEELLVDIEIFWGDDAYVSYCPVLNVSSQGKTVAEAERNIIEALRAFVGSCHRRGTLDRVLEEAGPARWSSPATARMLSLSSSGQTCKRRK